MLSQGYADIVQERPGSNIKKEIASSSVRCEETESQRRGMRERVRERASTLVVS